MNVAPNSVSGRVVNTSMGPAPDANEIVAPSDRPIQLRCIVLMDSGQAEDVEVVDQAVRVRRDPHHPLAHVAPEHRVVTAVAAPLGRDLLVGEDRAQARAPVDRRLRDVGQTVVVDHDALLDRAELAPKRGHRASARAPDSSSARSSSIGRARSCSASYQDSKIFRKIHCVQR